MTNELATVQNNMHNGIQQNNVHNTTALSPAMTVAQAVQQYKIIQDIVGKVLVEGRDYGVIPGTRGGPSLWKPGAEKLCGIFGLAVTIIGIETNRQEHFLEYTVTVELVSRHTGAAVGQGIGSCNSGERKYKNVPVADLQNTLLKMAKKRAQIDAVLSATGASGFFQDEDDSDLEPARPQQNSQRSQPRRPPQNAQQGPQQGNSQGNGQSAPQANAPRIAQADELAYYEERRQLATELGLTPPGALSSGTPAAKLAQRLQMVDSMIAEAQEAARNNIAVTPGAPADTAPNVQSPEQSQADEQTNELDDSDPFADE